MITDRMLFQATREYVLTSQWTHYETVQSSASDLFYFITVVWFFICVALFAVEFG